MKSSRFIYLPVLVVSAVVSGIAVLDYVRFERAHRRIVHTAGELGGRAGSTGGWPFGLEQLVRFDRPLSDDAIRRLADAAPESRRICLSVYLSCEVPEARLAEMRNMVAPHRIRISAAAPSQETPQPTP